MKKFLFAIFALLFSKIFAANFSASQGLQRNIFAGDFIYDAMAAICAECGQVSFATNAPLTADEILGNLRAIDRETLSDAGKSYYDAILDALNLCGFGFSSNWMNVGIDPSLALAGYWKSNEKIGWHDEGKKRIPVFQLPIFISASDFLSGYFAVDVAPYESVSRQNENYSNIPLGTKKLDGNFPHDAFFSVGARRKEKGFLNFQISKGAISIGKSLMGSLVLSDFCDDISFAKLSAFSPKIRFSSYATQLEVNKYFYFHHFEVRPFGRLNFSFLEGSLVNAPLELRFLNPMMIFHGFGAWQDYDDYDSDVSKNSEWNKSSNSGEGGDARVSSFLALSLEGNPFKRMRLYFTFAMNQLQLDYEKDTQPQSAYIPNGMGFQGGIEGWIPAGRGFLRLGAEAIYTQPWFYIARSPKWSFVRDKKELYLGDNKIRNWTGSPLGPDTAAVMVCAEYAAARRWGASLRWRLKMSGEQSKAIFDSVDENGNPNYYTDANGNRNLKTPSGVCEYENTVALSGFFEAFRGVEFRALAAFVHLCNADHFSGKTRFGFECQASCRIKIHDFAKELFL